MKPCPKCGSSEITFGARSPPGPPGRVFVCRNCLYSVAYDTPDRGADIIETIHARNCRALALWSKAKAQDMKRYT